MESGGVRCWEERGQAGRCFSECDVEQKVSNESRAEAMVV